MDQATQSATTLEHPITVAIVAMGGQGGGVLADWIAKVGRDQGYTVQATSVPGVAQRTGATIYYIEMIKSRSGSVPVLALMPTMGDVDIVIASELMEAGRAILRGLVTPDRTLLIASTQRAFAISEKEKPGDGIVDSGAVYTATEIAARRHIVADFARVADSAGSVISASLLGALSASDGLPFARSAFEKAIRAGGIGVDASLKAFAQAHELVSRNELNLNAPAKPDVPALPLVPHAVGVAALDALLDRIRHELPAQAHGMAFAGIKHLVDYQDVAYAQDYLTLVSDIASLDRAHGGDGSGFVLTIETARHLARGMAYDDVIRVADLKTRAARERRVASEVAIVAELQLLQTTEYFHPRMDEVCATLPAGLGAAIERRPRLFKMLDRLVNRGRRVRTDTVFGFLQLHLIAGRKTQRRTTLRHGREMAQIAAWLGAVKRYVSFNPPLSVEVVMARRLVKGYSDTIARGISKFDRVMAGAQLVSHRGDAADWVKRLHLAALADEDGVALDGALKTLATLETPAQPQFTSDHLHAPEVIR
jgi:indolepyruvate ferredoxin oxidoreductase, beta subunit